MNLDYLNNRIYIALNISESSVKLLKEFAHKFNFDLTYDYDDTKIDENDFQFHTTLMYSQNYSIRPIKIRRYKNTTN